MEAEDAEGWLRMREVHGEGHSRGRQILGFQVGDCVDDAADSTE